MDPYAPQPQQSLQQQPNPYDFIMNPGKPPKRRLLGGGTSSTPLGLMLCFIIGGAVLLIIILWIVATLLGGNRGNTEEYIGLVQTQQELIRISDSATTEGIQQRTRNYAITTSYSLLSQQKQTTDFLATRGASVPKEQLGLKQNSTTDQQLASAKTTNTFDLVYAQIIQTQLSAYANTVRQVYQKSTNDEARKMLAAQYDQTQLLIKSIPSND